MEDTSGASGKPDRAVVNGAASVSALRASVPSAFAVLPFPVKRKTATSGNPLSCEWTLYNPEALAADLGLPVEQVHAALERNGFTKAVHVRMEVLRWKERLRKEERALADNLEELCRQRKIVADRLATVREALVNTRNILRLPRSAQGIPTEGGDASAAPFMGSPVPQGCAKLPDGP